MPHQLYGPSDYDLRHQFNANCVYDLPFGRGQLWGSASSKAVNGVLGGWKFSGLTRWTSGYPFSIDSYPFATGYEQDGRAVLLGAATKTGT
jgi:hypothetical protein